LGFFGDYREFYSKEPHSENPYVTWTAVSYWGFGGFISTTGKFLKLTIYIDRYQSRSPEKIIFSDRKEP
jgi:hypothetical protein